MRVEQVRELQDFGDKIETKVTPTFVKGEHGVNIRDYQFTDFLKAARFLQHIQQTELPESFLGLIG